MRTTPLLLTPGPLSTPDRVRARMAVDYGSRAPAFVAMSDTVRRELTRLVGDEATWVTVPLQGSGTFAVEAAIGTLLPRDGRLLVVINGAYGHRIAQITRTLGREVVTVETPEDTAPDLARVEELLAADPAITHVAAIVCETTTGMANPTVALAEIVERHGRRLILDAMSAFGVFDLMESDLRFDALVASSNKCLEGPPGMGFVVVRRDVLAGCKGNSPSVSLDLYAQAARFAVDGQWRFTPPTHIVAALSEAITAFLEEGGTAGRRARYVENQQILIVGLRAMGFRTLLPDAQMSPIIVTFLEPADPRYDFEAFYDGLRDAGFAIYPGKLTERATFRVGCIGQVFPDDMRAFVEAVRQWLANAGIESGAPATDGW